MKLHLPIALRRALMAIYAVLRPVGITAALAATTAMADTLEDDDVSITGDATYSGLIMKGTDTNRIEVPISDDAAFTLTINGDGGNLEMITSKGVNAIKGNVAELVPYIEKVTGSWIANMFSDVAAAPTVNVERGAVIMNGPANLVMLGSSVTGNKITMSNSGGLSTTAYDVVGGVLGGYDWALDAIPSIKPNIGDKLEMLKEIKGNFNIIQGSTVGSAATENVSMHASAPSSGDLAANLIVGGSTVQALKSTKAEDGTVSGGDIDMTGMATVIVNTDLVDVANAVVSGSGSMVNKLAGVLSTSGTATTIAAANDINLKTKATLLHGGNLAGGSGAALVLDAENDVNITGAAAVISGNTIINATDINLTGEQKTTITTAELNTLGKLVGAGNLGDTAKGLLDKIGMGDKLDAGMVVSGNAVMGGATLTAGSYAKDGSVAVEGSITTGGTVSAFLNTSTTDVINALLAVKNATEEKPVSELEILSGLLQNSGVSTSVTATKDINLGARLNLLHGGNFEGGADAALKLTAGEKVDMTGTFNVVSGNVIVDAETIELKGQQNISLDWGALVPDKYAAYGEIADSMGIFDKLEKGVNGNVVAGGAKLTADYIKMDGMATAIVDTTASNVVDALRTMNATPLVEGGEHTTSLKATNIDLVSRLNVVNGGKVLIDATETVKMEGTFNVVSGNANVKGKDVSMDADEKVGIDISSALNGHYAEVAEELGMTDMVKNGLSSNVIAGGAKVSADNDVTMKGYATAIVDTSLGNVIDAAKQNDLGQLMKGGSNETLVSAVHDIKLESDLIVVNGGNADNARGNTSTAGGVTLDAGHDVNIGGDLSVINRATVKAVNDVDITSGKAVLKNTTITAGDVNITSGKAVLKNTTIDAGGIVSFKNTKAEMTDGSISGAEVQVTNATLSNTADSTVTISDKVTVTDNASIENYGSLTLSEAVITNSTLYSDSANTTVTGSLTLQSATLVYTAESLTLNDTAIMLGGDKVLITEPNTALIGSSFDAIAGVNFVISSESLGKDVFSEGGAYFELALFEGGGEYTRGLIEKCLEADEVSFTVYDTGWNATVSDRIEVKLTEDGHVVVTGNVSVPEPTTATLSLLALAALAGRRRRK